MTKMIHVYSSSKPIRLPTGERILEILVFQIKCTSVYVNEFGITVDNLH
jgi:hypothetical protein